MRNFKSVLKKSMSLPYFKTRLLAALVLMPVMPYLVLFIARLGFYAGEELMNVFMIYAESHPEILVIYAATGFSLMVGTIFILISPSKDRD